jgi:hypothetical protein
MSMSRLGLLTCLFILAIVSRWVVSDADRCYVLDNQLVYSRTGTQLSLKHGVQLIIAFVYEYYRS